MSFFQKFGPLLTTVALGVAGALSPTVQGAVKNNPTASILISLGVAILHALLPSVLS